MLDRGANDTYLPQPSRRSTTSTGGRMAPPSAKFERKAVLTTSKESAKPVRRLGLSDVNTINSHFTFERSTAIRFP